MCQTFPALQSSPSAVGWSEGLLAQQQHSPPQQPPRCSAWGAPHSPHLCFAGCKDISRHFIPSLAKTYYISCVFCGNKALSPLLQNKGHHKYLPLLWLALPKLFPRSSMIPVQTYVPLLALPSSPAESTALPVLWGVCFRACHILAGTKTWS